MGFPVIKRLYRKLFRRRTTTLPELIQRGDPSFGFRTLGDVVRQQDARREW